MFSRIVVPLDGSTLAERAIPLAREMADRSDGSIRLVRVHVPPRIPATCHQVLGPRVGGELKRSREAARARDQQYLEEARKPAGEGEDEGPDVSTALLRGPEGHSVVDEVRRSDATLVVMSVPVPGRDEPDELGAPRDTVVRGCPTPVLIVRTGDVPPGAAPAVPEHVLVPLDGTRRSEAVLKHATAVARLFDAPMTLIRVMRHDGRVEEDRHDGEGDRSAESYLEDLAEELRHRGVEVDTHVGQGDPVAAILEAARDRDTDLIAMASRCRGPLTRLVLGSVSDKVLRRTSASVLVVNPTR